MVPCADCTFRKLGARYCSLIEQYRANDEEPADLVAAWAKGGPCESWLKELTLVEWLRQRAGSERGETAQRLQNAANELERMQADAALLDALQEMAETNGYVGMHCYSGEQWDIKAGSRDIPPSTGGIRGLLDNLRQWMTEDKAQREADCG